MAQHIQDVYSNKYVQDNGEVNPNDLIAFDMCCCCVDSLYLKYPDFFGYFILSTCCCCEGTASGCKPHSTKICLCSKYDVNFIYPTTCCKCVSQVGPYDCRSSFPCDHDVPCGFGCCGFTCCFNYDCTPTFFVKMRLLQEGKKWIFFTESK